MAEQGKYLNSEKNYASKLIIILIQYTHQYCQAGIGQRCSHSGATYDICCIVAEISSGICSEYCNKNDALDMALILCILVYSICKLILQNNGLCKKGYGGIPLYLYIL